MPQFSDPAVLPHPLPVITHVRVHAGVFRCAAPHAPRDDADQISIDDQRPSRIPLARVPAPLRESGAQLALGHAAEPRVILVAFHFRDEGHRDLVEDGRNLDDGLPPAGHQAVFADEGGGVPLVELDRFPRGVEFERALDAEEGDVVGRYAVQIGRVPLVPDDPLDLVQRAARVHVGRAGAYLVRGRGVRGAVASGQHPVGAYDAPTAYVVTVLSKGDLVRRLVDRRRLAPHDPTVHPLHHVQPIGRVSWEYFNVSYRDCVGLDGSRRYRPTSSQTPRIAKKDGRDFIVVIEKGTFETIVG